ncbi:heme ABC exporter ATP-binding protein CcmA [Afifella pfennigii]|uniref:heme ABC exporter ATP-binding protein CcmA n=1 Tax=Afifella pfennigii TaxID=209897 RepID=UPI00047B7E04|nr:heme ABC exporter ATP-binding protein CcmA [Afifella pfennigii]
MPLEDAFPPVRLAADDLACERGGRPIFHGLSFSLAGGEMLAVVGPNGAGKSSLLRVVAGLLSPSEGRVDLDTDGERETAMHLLAYGDGLRNVFTVKENLRLWSRLYGGAADDDAMHEALEEVGLGHAMHLAARALSTGQRRRAGLARLILSPRPIWLLDEPTSGLDKDGEAILGRMMAEHLASGGAILVATHLQLPVAPTHRLELQ